MYKSPIEAILTDFRSQYEGEILKAVRNYNIIVDKEELLKALQYDRDQYRKGYDDAMATIVRCKDCKYYKEYIGNTGSAMMCFCPCCLGGQGKKSEDDYCSYGERREDAEVH